MLLYREIDLIAHQALQDGRLTVNPYEGAVYKPDGTRAEWLDRHHMYGRVPIQGRDAIWAHRLVWIAAHGPIPADELVTHLNGRGWDNRIENLATRTKRVRTGTLVPRPD